MSKRDEERRRKEEQGKRILWIAAIIVVALIVAAILIVPGLMNTQQSVSNISVPTEFPRPQANGRSMGNPNAPVKVVEYADFLCSHCRDFAQETEPEIVQKYVATGKVYFTYFPYPFLSSDSVTPAEAALCAMDQNKFWPYHDILYENMVATEGNPIDQAHLEAYAQKVGLDLGAFKTCRSSGKHQQEIKDLLAAGKAAKVQGTPSFQVGDQLVFQDKLISSIDDALKAAGQ
jgi:protein-disulfide isomerase